MHYRIACIDEVGEYWFWTDGLQEPEGPFSWYWVDEDNIAEAVSYDLHTHSIDYFKLEVNRITQLSRCNDKIVLLTMSDDGVILNQVLLN